MEKVKGRNTPFRKAQDAARVYRKMVLGGYPFYAHIAGEKKVPYVRAK